MQDPANLPFPRGDQHDHDHHPDTFHPAPDPARLHRRRPGRPRPLYADPKVSRHIGDGTPADRATTWRALAGTLGHWQLRGYGTWALIEQATGRLIGRAGLYNPEGWPGLEAGWLLARDRWGHGFATEAGHAILAHAFTQLSADHLISLIHPANTASIRVAERLGEHLEREIDLKGQPALVYGTNRQRWQQGRQAQTRSI